MTITDQPRTLISYTRDLARIIASIGTDTPDLPHLRYGFRAEIERVPGTAAAPDLGAASIFARFYGSSDGPTRLRLQVISDEFETIGDYAKLRDNVARSNRGRIYGAPEARGVWVGDRWEFTVVAQYGIPITAGLDHATIHDIVVTMVRIWTEAVTTARELVVDPKSSAAAPADPATSVIDEINALVGLDSVKDFANQLVALKRYHSLCSEKGANTTFNAPHLVFVGEPGTGKTTAARLIGRLYVDAGLLEKGHVVEVDRSKLVAKYVGHTAVQTREVCESALGGVLFIDESYSLFGTGNDFGHEAVETLMTFMENNRGNLAVVLAGYTEQMEKLLDSNPGLRSRFDTMLSFDAFTDAQLVAIFSSHLRIAGCTITEAALHCVANHIRGAHSAGYELNARNMRQLADEVMLRHAQVVSTWWNPSNTQLTTVSLMSLPRAWQTSDEVSLDELPPLVVATDEVRELAALEYKWEKLFAGLQAAAALDSPEDFQPGSVNQLLAAVRLIQPFTWTRWGVPFPSRDEIDNTTLADCIKHVTRIVRASRVSEDVMWGAIKSGSLMAICKVAHRRARCERVPTLEELEGGR